MKIWSFTVPGSSPRQVRRQPSAPQPSAPQPPAPGGSDVTDLAQARQFAPMPVDDEGPLVVVPKQKPRKRR